MKLCRLTVIAVLICLFITSACAEVVVFGDKLKVAYCNEYITLREEPSSKSAAIARIPLNSEVTWLYQDAERNYDDGEFYIPYSYVLFDGMLGYVASNYLELLPEEGVPDDTPLLDIDESRVTNYDIGCQYTIDTADYYLILGASAQDRAVLLPGDEVVMLEKGEGSSKIIFDERILSVPNEILRLKEDYRQSPVNPSRTEQYRLNAFFTDLSSAGNSIIDTSIFNGSCDEEQMLRFALNYLQTYYPEILRHADEDSWAGYTAVVEGGCIQALIERFFEDNYAASSASENWYDQLIYENIKEYHFVYTGESWDYFKNHLSCVDAVNALDDNQYAVRFHTYWSNNPLSGYEGFAIIYAPNGLASSKDWILKYCICI